MNGFIEDNVQGIAENKQQVSERYVDGGWIIIARNQPDRLCWGTLYAGVGRVKSLLPDVSGTEWVPSEMSTTSQFNPLNTLKPLSFAVIAPCKSNEVSQCRPTNQHG